MKTGGPRKRGRHRFGSTGRTAHSSTPSSWEELGTDPLAIWTEQTFGLREDDEGNQSRQVPTRLHTAAEALANETGVDEDTCEDRLRDLLAAGSKARDDQGRPLFAFKLHQFIAFQWQIPLPTTALSLSAVCPDLHPGVKVFTAIPGGVEPKSVTGP